jgi:flavin-dependent dehydrogenase
MGGSVNPKVGPTWIVVGDAAGSINPFNGEGIDYAMESGQLAAEVGLAVLESGDRTRLSTYRAALERSFGSYFTLGRVFVRAIGHPQVMKACARYGLPRPTLMKLVLKLMANLYEPARGDATDRIVRAMVRLAPSR